MKFQHLQLKSFANSKGARHKKYGKKEDFCHWRQMGGGGSDGFPYSGVLDLF